MAVNGFISIQGKDFWTPWSTGTNEQSLLEHQRSPGISYAWNKSISVFMIIYLGLSCATAGYSIPEDCMADG